MSNKRAGFANSLDKSVEMSRLNNGLTIATVRMPHVETASLGLWIGQGSRDESAAEHGIAHFLEHMVFKGTGSRTARQHAEEIEAVGGEINAATGVESTGYFARVMGADCDLAIDLIADMLLDPLITEADVERERAVILQEMAADGDEPEDLAHDALQATAFPGQALGRPIIGTRASVSGIMQDGLRRHLQRVLCAPRMVLTAAGAIDHTRLLARATTHFSGIAAASPPIRPKSRYAGGRRILAQDFEQSHLLFGFPAPGRHDPGANAVSVLANILGGGASSRLFQSVREERGLCYAVDAFFDPYSDTGLFGLYAATRAEAVPEVVSAIVSELQMVLDAPVTPGELSRGRAQGRMGLASMLESTGALAEHLAHEILEFGRVRPPAELIARIDAVDAAAVRTAADRVLTTAPPTLVEVGSEAGAPHFHHLEAWHRDTVAGEPIRGDPAWRS